MKLTLVVVSACLTLSIACAAQTDNPRPKLSPQILQILRNVHAGSGALQQTAQGRAETKAYLVYINETEHDGKDALHAGDFQAAEDKFRALVEADSSSPYACFELAEALAGQGKIAEAIQQYRHGIAIFGNKQGGTLIPLVSLAEGAALPAHAVSSDSECYQPEEARAWMQYALLLSQTGQQAEAVMVYNKAFPMMSDGHRRELQRLPDPATLSPAAFQSSVHIVLGMYIALEGWPVSNHTQAIQEFDTALRLAPNSPLANYYYGYGWQKLPPAQRAKLAANPGQLDAVKAALKKAAKPGAEYESAAEMKVLQ